MTTGLDLLLLVGLAISVYTDVRTRRIKNAVTFPLMVVGLAGHLVTNGAEGGLFALGGMGMALTLYLPFALLGGMGMGDVKLLLAVGAVKGPVFVLDAALFAVFLSAFFFLLVSLGQGARVLKNTGALVLGWFLTRSFHRLPAESSAWVVSFAVFIALGVAAAYLSGGDLIWRFVH